MKKKQKLRTHDGLSSLKSVKAAKGLTPYALLEAFMLMGLVLLASTGFMTLLGDSYIPGIAWQLPHVLTILSALIISQFFFGALLWPAVVFYSVTLGLDVTVFIWRAVTMSMAYTGNAPSYYLDSAFIRLWAPEGVMLLLFLIDIGQIIRLVSINQHEKNYLTKKEKEYYSALYRPKAIKLFTVSQVVAIFDACYIVLYFLLVFYYLTGFTVNNLVWIQSIHFVTWFVAIGSSVTKDVRWLIPMAAIEVFALVLDATVFIIYAWSLIYCMNGTSPQSCTNSQLEEFLMLIATLVLIVLDGLQVIVAFILLHVHRKFDVNRSK